MSPRRELNRWRRLTPGEVRRKPRRRETGDLLERAGLLEQVRRAGNDLEALRRGELCERSAVEGEHLVIGAPDDEQRRRANALDGRREVGPTPAGDDRAHIRPLRGNVQ